MQIVEKYRKILEKPMAEPFRGYIEELVNALDEKPVTVGGNTYRKGLQNKVGPVKFVPANAEGTKGIVEGLEAGNDTITVKK